MHVVKTGQSDVVYIPVVYIYSTQYMYTCACHSWRVLVAGLLEMDPRVSATILGLLDRIPGAESLPQQFPLLFSNVAQTSTAPKQPSTSASQVSHAQKVGTQVMVISGGNSSLNVGSRGDSAGLKLTFNLVTHWFSGKTQIGNRKWLRRFMRAGGLG